jgi:hypothetical protein
VAELSNDRIAVDPRREFRARQAAREQGLPGRAVGDPPPGLLPDGPASRPRWDPRIITPGPSGPEPFDPYTEALRIQLRPGQKPNRHARVRIYHRPDHHTESCWAFTISRAAWERLRTEGVLDSEGATYPDGRSIVGPGEDPLLTAWLHCGTCGTHSVECLQMEFFQD